VHAFLRFQIQDHATGDPTDQDPLALLERRRAELEDACARLRRVLARWDDLLAATPRGRRAALLDALDGLVDPGSPSPFLPDGLRGRGKREG